MTTADPEPRSGAGGAEASESAAAGQVRHWLHDLPVEGLRLSDESNVEILARRLVDEKYLTTLEDARVAAAHLIALAQAAATRQKVGRPRD